MERGQHENSTNIIFVIIFTKKVLANIGPLYDCIDQIACHDFQLKTEKEEPV